MTILDTIDTSTDLDALDLSHCVIGPDLVIYEDRGITRLYRRSGHALRLLGEIDDALSAWAALDQLDTL